MMSDAEVYEEFKKRMDWGGETHAELPREAYDPTSQELLTRMVELGLIDGVTHEGRYRATKHGHRVYTLLKI